MENIKRARQRLQNYPSLLAKCSASAALYATCVTRDLNVKQNICEKEFIEFKRCLNEAAKRK
ncbi:uncharacterized protein LOC116342593 [Contarinia nasturtii]|uniref:uncharacterized protein LOC116342593 n=1 Tax=Contarinia nasturtii TaxID=265458 RepID=UPI0012D3B420|nr:uncharacterized protein LOC116342593 [Contarinia nasturtii]